MQQASQWVSNTSLVRQAVSKADAADIWFTKVHRMPAILLALIWKMIAGRAERSSVRYSLLKELFSKGLGMNAVAVSSGLFR